MATLTEVLQAAFSSNYQINEQVQVIFGQGTIEKNNFHIIGVKESTFLGVEQSLVMSEKLLDILSAKSKDPIFLLVDVAGQALTMRDEWLAMHQYFSHLLMTLECLRQQGNKLISLVYNGAIGGGFIAYGLMADTILALPEAKVAVMWLEGMAKVTKISLEKLQELSKTSPVFAPGIDNFLKLGGIHDIVQLTQLPAALLKYKDCATEDQRAQLGFERGGRKLAYPVINKILGQV